MNAQAVLTVFLMFTFAGETSAQPLSGKIELDRFTDDSSGLLSFGATSLVSG
jgi:hypothetical protein